MEGEIVHDCDEDWIGIDIDDEDNLTLVTSSC